MFPSQTCVPGTASEVTGLRPENSWLFDLPPDLLLQDRHAPLQPGPEHNPGLPPQVVALKYATRFAGGTHSVRLPSATTLPPQNCGPGTAFVVPSSFLARHCLSSNSQQAVPRPVLRPPKRQLNSLQPGSQYLPGQLPIWSDPGTHSVRLPSATTLPPQNCGPGTAFVVPSSFLARHCLSSNSQQAVPRPVLRPPRRQLISLQPGSQYLPGQLPIWSDPGTHSVRLPSATTLPPQNCEPGTAFVVPISIRGRNWKSGHLQQVVRRQLLFQSQYRVLPVQPPIVCGPGTTSKVSPGVMA